LLIAGSSMLIGSVPPTNLLIAYADWRSSVLAWLVDTHRRVGPPGCAALDVTNAVRLDERNACADSEIECADRLEPRSEPNDHKMVMSECASLRAPSRIPRSLIADACKFFRGRRGFR
jgi:hypothetical protein